MIDGGAHDLDSLISEFEPSEDEAPDTDGGPAVVLPKKRRKRHPSCKPDGHIHLCPCPSCMKARPERAAAMAAQRKPVKKKSHVAS